MQRQDLYRTPPGELIDARLLAHSACQWPSKAARANLGARPDDGHSNLGWADEFSALVSRNLDDVGHRLAFEFADCRLLWLRGDELVDVLSLDANELAVGSWVDARLADADLQGATSAEMPYQLDPTDLGLSPDTSAAMRNLGLWYRSAHHALTALTGSFTDLSVVPVQVRCWPHHFDIAVLFALDEGDPETARSIGVGLSPGDGSYQQPYYYCSPWPAPVADLLVDPPEPFHWHTEGFVSLIVTADELRPGIGQLDDNLAAAVELSRNILR